MRLAAFYFAFFAHAGAFVAYFPLYLAGLGLNAAEIALALAMPQVARIVAPGLWGWLADAWGARHGGARRAIVRFSTLVIFTGFIALTFQERAGAIALTLLAISLLSAGASPVATNVVEAGAIGAAAGGASRARHDQ